VSRDLCKSGEAGRRAKKNGSSSLVSSSSHEPREPWPAQPARNPQQRSFRCKTLSRWSGSRKTS
jgi:hypothetical protein